MASSRFGVGDAVQTSFGKGVVIEVRNGGRLLVEVHGRGLVLDAALVTPNTAPLHRRAAAVTHRVDAREARAERPRPTQAAREIDLHGLTVEAALERVNRALNEALLADLAELRLVHGKSGGRIRAALHTHLRTIPSVRGFRLDPRNEGVTIATL